MLVIIITIVIIIITIVVAVVHTRPPVLFTFVNIITIVNIISTEIPVAI